MSQVNQTRTVTSSQLKTALKHLASVQRPAFIWGPPGIGKSSVVEALCNELGGKLYDVRLSQCEPTDLRGMPYFDHNTATMKWAPPVDLPSAEEAAQYPVVVLFLDEMNSAAPNLQAAAYQLVLSRRIGTYELPENCIVIAAGNRAGDRGVVYTMPKPLSNRFIHFEMRADFDSWNEWAFSAGIHPNVIGFLNFSKNSLNAFDPKSPDPAFATSRTWEFVSDIEKSNADEDTKTNIISGTIGEGMALTYMAHSKTMGKMPNPTDILTGKVTELEDKNISIQYSLMTSLLYEVKEKYSVMLQDGEYDKWIEYTDNMLNFFMDNFDVEITVSGMRMGFRTMNIKFDRTKMKSMRKFFEGPGKLILKSLED